MRPQPPHRHFHKEEYIHLASSSLLPVHIYIQEICASASVIKSRSWELSSPSHYDPSEVEMRTFYDFNLFNVAVSQIAAVKSDSDWESPDRRAAVSKMLPASLIL